jgi:glycosyltransferase involved in cell wall biosynthesis
MTRVSVLLPVYNGGPFLRGAIASILAQTMADLELLIVDDGSTDASPETISQLAAADRRIRFWSRPNKGLVHTLNELLDHAKSPFIARMDADDLAAPDRFERQLRELENDEQLLAVGSDVYSIDSKGRRLMTIVMPRSHQEIEAYTLSVVHGCGMCHPSMMFKARAFALAGRYREEFWPAEDADLVLRIAEHGKLANIPLPLLSYRVHGDSIGHRQAARQRDALFRAAAGAAERRGLAPLPDSLRELPGDQQDRIEAPVSRDVKWAWWALNSGNVSTARALAFRAVWNGPFTRAAWLVLACAIRGH